MDKTCFVRTVAVLAIVLFVTIELRAQQASPAVVAYQVSGLTSAVRDQLVQQVDAQGDVKLAYACVPAGILVFEQANGAQRADLDVFVEGLIAQQVGRSGLVPVATDRQQLEALCAAARNN